MKKKNKKLTISKKTIASLDTFQMNLKAGGGPVATHKCYTEWKCTRRCIFI